MTPDEKVFITEQFKNLHEKIDLKVSPICEKVTAHAGMLDDHGRRIGTLELFKEGHQQAHITETKEREAVTEKKRFGYEVFIGPVIVGLIFIIAEQIL